MTKLTQARVRELLDYDPATGVFRRKTTAGGVRKGEIVGSRDTCGYLLIRVDGERHKAHRLAFLWMLGAFPQQFVDHKNMRRDDNTWANLREATPSQNKANSRGWKRKVLGVKGVYPRNSRYRALLCEHGTHHYLGTYDTIDEARSAYMDAAKKHFGEFARC